jgi:ribA/ribD-fused uncharacterized protein
LDPAKTATQKIGEVTIFFTNQSPLSNHYMDAPFDLKGKRYKCTEQYYFASMAKAFGDDDAYKEVMKQSDPVKMLQAGKKAINHSDAKWEELQFGIMLEANVEKYKQNDGAREALRATGETKLGKQASSPRTGGQAIRSFTRTEATQIYGLDRTKWARY